MRRALCGAVLWTVACGSTATDRPPGAGENAPGAAAPTAHGPASPPWPDFIGEFVAVENASRGEALLFRRDTVRIPAHLRVVGYDSASTPVDLRDVRDLPCASRALLRVLGAPGGWSVALDSAHARPVLIDALEDLSPADSQRVVVRVQRALNTLPDSAAAMEFHGLPVVVRDAWVVHVPAGPLVVARAARFRNLEATAHEELRFVVLEQEQLRFVARVAGDEEVVESWDLLAALLTDRGPVLAIAREGPRSLQLELVALDHGEWRSVWRSDALACSVPR